MAYTFPPTYIVSFGPEAVVKKAEPERMRIEVEKTRRAFKIGKDSGLFRVPRVLDYDNATGTATFERLHGLRPAGEVLARDRRCGELAERIGAVLAAIHRDLMLPADMVRPLSSDLRLPGETEVFLHGDFTVNNVCVVTADSALVVLDWQATDVYGGDATFGTRYFDLSWFLAGLFFRPLHRYFGCQPPKLPGGAFLRSYFRASGSKHDWEEMRLYMKRVIEANAAAQWKRHSLALRFSLMPAMLRRKLFIRSVKP